MRSKLGASSSKKKREKRIKLPSISKLKKEADRIFSLYIRERDNYTCYTCGKKGDKTNMDCGHYKSRVFLGTRYDEKNCHCQDKSCNIFKSGNLTVYAIRLEKDYGQGIPSGTRR